MTQSPWPSASPGADVPVELDLRVPIAVVGAGIAGLSVAYELARRGHRAVVVDAHGPGGGETHNTTAHLASVIDDRFVHLEDWIGADGARLARESHAAAIDRIEETIARHDIPCGFRRVDGHLFAAPGRDKEDFLLAEWAAARRAGHTGAEWLDAVPLAGSALEGCPCIRFPNQATFDPGLYLNGLAEAVRGLGVPIFTHTRVTGWKREGKVVVLETERGPRIAAGRVVFACNDPFVRLRYFTVSTPYRTYAAAYEVAAGSAAAEEDGLFWDTEDPYHYVRFAPHPDGSGRRMVIVGGEDHKTGHSPEHGTMEEAWGHLDAWTRVRLPFAGSLLRKWSGQVLETLDGLGLIGADPKEEGRVFLVSGDSGMGLTHGTLAGPLIADLIEGQQNDWARIYDPGRFPWKRAAHYLAENADIVAQYGRHLLPPASATTFPTGSNGSSHGVIVRRDGEKIARARTEKGEVCELHAVCPHLGGPLTWNEAEGTWDCACHGSRFDAEGEVVNGPATSPLRAPEHAHSQ